MGKRRCMWVNADRVFYGGLLGIPSSRALGAYAIYLSPVGTHELAVSEGPRAQAEMSVIPPFVRHRISSAQRGICTILLEAETIDPCALSELFGPLPCAVRDPAWLSAMRASVDELLASGGPAAGSTADFDEQCFGRVLRRRVVDSRVAEPISRMKQRRSEQPTAEDCARAAHLSVSRFLHLFKSEVGVSFRNYRTWQRARGLLEVVTSDASLTDFALDFGYADSTHFSHSIRQIFGRTPRSIFAGSRELTLVNASH